jgi:hypothetical protein
VSDHAAVAQEGIASPRHLDPDCDCAPAAIMFLICSPVAATTGHGNTPTLRPATADEIAQTLAFALRFEGRKRVRYADEIMAEITAERLVAHLERSGYVVMKKPPAVAPPTSTAPISGRSGT